MRPEEFCKFAYENDEKGKDYYGIFPPPTNAQVGLNILIKHFLGEDWYTTLSMHNEQVNTEAIAEILYRYPNKEDKKKNRKDKLDALIYSIKSIFK